MKPHLRRDLVVVAALVIVTGVYVAGVFLANGSAPRFGKGGYTLSAVTPQAASLGKGGEVREAGLPVGQVASVERRGTNAIIRLDIDDKYGPLPADTKFRVRLRSLVGENYVDLLPGKSKSMLKSGSTLGTSANEQEYVELEQVLDELKGKTRQRAQALIQDVGEGLEDRGEPLNRTLQGTAGVVENIRPLASVLDREREPTTRLVAGLGALTSDIGDRGQAIRTLADQASLTFDALASRDDQLKAMIDALPPLLTQVKSTSGVLRGVTRDATPVVTDLSRAVSELDPSVRLLRPAAQEGREVVRELGSASPALETILQRVRKAAPPTVAALPQLRATLCQLNPAVKYLRPYATNVGAFLENLQSATNFYDANGHAGRFLALVGENSFAPLTPETSDALKLLTTAGAIGDLNSRGYEPYPVAGDGNPTSTGAGQTNPRDYGRTYPRVKAEC